MGFVKGLITYLHRFLAIVDNINTVSGQRKLCFRTVGNSLIYRIAGNIVRTPWLACCQSAYK